MPYLKWRHTGFGALQAYLHEGDETEMRVHIWHPDLKKLGMTDQGDIHDHRFKLRSYVLYGAMVQEEFSATLNECGKWRCHAVTHAREAERTTGDFHNVKTGELYCDAVLAAQIRVEAGWVYDYPKRAFHRSLVDQLTVTLVEKTEQDEVPARILSLRSAPVVHAFIDTFDKAEFMPFVAHAATALLGD